LGFFVSFLAFLPNMGQLILPAILLWLRNSTTVIALRYMSFYVFVVLQVMAKRVPNMEQLILRLRKNNMLPAIWFILSRKASNITPKIK
jgi:hypothetical protein